MARYKHIDTSPRLLPVDLARQLLPGTFEHALNHLLDSEIDLSWFDARFCNDETGATAYPPAMLLKVVLFAYSRGVVSSRGIERACREQVTFIALCGDSSPHFTTVANFVACWRPNARLRAATVPGPPESEPADEDAHGAPARMNWARLRKRVFGIDIEHCPQCGGALKIIAAIEEPAVIVRILTHLGLPARAPPRSPARPLALFQAA
jgi:hypothetical protein